MIDMTKVMIKQWLDHMQRMVSTDAIDIILIDGRCGSGKTRLGETMAHFFKAPVVHMDDFYLPFDKRAGMDDFPGNHMDYNRLQHQVVDPFIQYHGFDYVPFDAHSNHYGLNHHYNGQLLIIEGSYSMHPLLRYTNHTYRLFLTIDPSFQKKRIIGRGGPDCWTGFETRWIPAEERYFESYCIKAHADQTISYDGQTIIIQSMKTVS